MARELAQHASNSQAEANLLSYATDLEREADELDDDTPNRGRTIRVTAKGKLRH